MVKVTRNSWGHNVFFFFLELKSIHKLIVFGYCLTIEMIETYEIEREWDEEDEVVFFFFFLKEADIINQA